MRRERIVPGPTWPAWFYSPTDDYETVCASQEEVPAGWTRKRGIPEPQIEAPTFIPLDKEGLLSELKAKGIDINPQWGSAHMKRIIDGDVSPTG